MRFQLIQGIADRTAALTEGDAKRKLQTRLDVLMQQYAARVAAATASEPESTVTTTPSQHTPLTRLLKHLATLTAAADDRALSNSVGSLRERYPELPVLDEFRSTWSRVSANRQVRQSEAQVHENAGPLNSSHLVHRTLSMMRDVSPGYLHQFLSYLDALAWMEQLHMAEESTGKEGKRGAGKSAKPTKRTTTRAKKKPSSDSES